MVKQSGLRVLEKAYREIAKSVKAFGKFYMKGLEVSGRCSDKLPYI